MASWSGRNGLPPNTPKERVRLLRKAFDDTMKDAEFLAEADKAKIDIKPVNGEELEKSVQGVLQLESGLVAAEGDSKIISVSLAVIFYAGRATSCRARDTCPCG